MDTSESLSDSISGSNLHTKRSKFRLRKMQTLLDHMSKSKFHKESSMVCEFCVQPHPSYKCHLTLADRIMHIVVQDKCMICLQPERLPDHVYNCPAETAECPRCGQNHNFALCPLLSTNLTATINAHLNNQKALLAPFAEENALGIIKDSHQVIARSANKRPYPTHVARAGPSPQSLTKPNANGDSSTHQANTVPKFIAEAEGSTVQEPQKKKRNRRTRRKRTKERRDEEKNTEGKDMDEYLDDSLVIATSSEEDGEIK